MSKTIIITGASDGIGKAAARELHAQGHRVILVGRSAAKTKALAAELGAPYYLADFSKLSDVRELARKLRRAYRRIDVLANNAGGVFAKRTVTKDGFEQTFQVNYLAAFLLTGLLMNTLIRSHATIIMTASSAQHFNRFRLDDLNHAHHYGRLSTYGTSKLEDVMFARELSRRYAKKGIASASFHPGVVSTSFGRDLPRPIRFIFESPLMRPFGVVTPEKGADTLVWLATTDGGRDWKSGEYYHKRQVTKTAQKATNKRLANGLWNQSEDALMDKLEY